MTRLITSDQLKLAQLNGQVELTEQFLRLHVQVLWHLAVLRCKYQELEEEYNRLLHISQVRLYQDGYEHLMRLMEAEVQAYGPEGLHND